MEWIGGWAGHNCDQMSLEFRDTVGANRIRPLMFEPGWKGLEDGPRTTCHWKVPDTVGANRIRPLHIWNI